MRRSVVSAAVLPLAAFVALPTGALAATPASQSVLVPTSPGVTQTVTWSGLIPQGANPTSDCDTNTALADIETLHIDVPAGAYSNVSASFTFSIQWTPVST